MGVGICDECIDKYYPKVKKDNGWINPAWECEKCKNTTKLSRGYWGLDIKDFEEKYNSVYKEKDKNV